MGSIAQGLNSTKQITIRYKNWKDKVLIRHIIPINVWWGSTQYHTEQQWLLKAYDIDKQAERDFALLDIIEYIKD